MLLLPKTFILLSMPTTYQFKGQSSYMLEVTLKKMIGEKEKTYIYDLLPSRLFGLNRYQNACKPWFPSSSQLWTIITNWREAINVRLKQILDKLNVWRDSAVITKQTSQWDYYFPWAVLLHLIGCDILPPPHHSAAQWLKQPINQRFHPLHDYRWSLELPLKSCKGWQDSSAPHCFVRIG